MSSMAGSKEFKLGAEIGLPKSGFIAWHDCEEVVLLFWCME
jgi:hypothetical protein